MDNQKENGLAINRKSFTTALIVIFVLMAVTYGLTFLIPGGNYGRTVNEFGNTIIDPSSEFVSADSGIPFWKWILSPFLCLGADGSTSIIAVIIFLLVIGGIFACLNDNKLMEYMLSKIVHKYSHRRYTLLSYVTLFFMAMGAFIGSFEECVPLVPIVVGLAISFGWDALTGLGMSLIAVGCGFASGVCNPFTVGVAQRLAGLPMLSGIGFRLIAAVPIYCLLLLFLRHHAKHVEKPITCDNVGGDFVQSNKLDRALISFFVILGIGILVLISSSVITFLQDYAMIIVAIMFLVAGVVSSKVAGMAWGAFGKSFWNGLFGILPAVLMILMASSIKYTLTEANIIDSMLHGAVVSLDGMPKVVVVLFIYGLVLLLNFFIASGSAKAFLLIPLIVPIAAAFGISPQLCILAYAFGDGFSNVFYPTNPVLLISLGITNTSYTSYAKWSWKFQVLNLMLTCGILLLGLLIGY